MKRSLVLATAAAAALFTATAANAAHVNWSIGIAVPPVATYVSAPGYYQSQPYYAPPAVYAPAPAYYYPPRVAYAPRPFLWLSPQPRFWGGHHDRWHHDGRVDWRR